MTVAVRRFRRAGPSLKGIVALAVIAIGGGLMFMATALVLTGCPMGR